MIAPTTPASSDRARLVLDAITVRFGGIVAVDELSMSVGQGEICGLIGPNGAGKTTLFDVVSGVRRPAAGQVFLDGKDISGHRPAERCWRGVRRTFQRVQTFGWLTVEENVLAAMEWRSGGGRVVGDVLRSAVRGRRDVGRRARVEATLERCGLLEVRNECAGSLPIGIARMVEFARATVEPPSLLLLDEPASGLDEHEVARLAVQIEATRDETGCAVLVVEHDAEFIMALSDRVVVLELGKMLADGTPEDVRSNPMVQAAYLGADLHTGPEVHTE